MKPVKLIFQGINSFSEVAEIDFEKLLNSGLFGIFGKTGSGKSTILDCMMYALFAKTPRSQTIREYVNNKSSQAFVDFTFEILYGGKRRVYNIKRTIKINKRNLSDTTVALSEITDEGIVPYDDGDVNARIKDIIGIGYEEFSKCIILPQNEFASFVKAKRTDRLNLMSKLFSLEKYDVKLLQSLKTLKGGYLNKKSGIEGEMIHLQKYNNELVEGLKASQNAQKQRIEVLKESEIVLKEQIEKDNKAYLLKVSFDENESKIEQLERETEKVEKIRKILLCCADASNVQKVNFECAEIKKSASALKLNLEKFNSQMEEVEKKLKAVKVENAKDRSAQVNKMTVMLTRLESNESVVDDIERLRIDYQNSRKKVLEIKAKKDVFVREKEDLLNKIEQISDPTEALNTLFKQVASTSLSEEFNSQIEYFKDKISKLEEYEDCVLKRAVLKEIGERILYLNTQLDAISDNNVSLLSLTEKLNEIRRLSEQLAFYKDKLSSVEVEISSLDLKEEYFVAECNRLKNEGDVKKRILQDLSDSLEKDVTNKQNFIAVFNSLKNKITLLNNEITAYIEQEQQLSEKLNQIKVEVAQTSERRLMQEEAFKLKTEELDKLIETSPFSSVSEALSFVLDEKKVLEYNLYVEDYNKKFSSATALRVSLSEQLSVLNFNLTEFMEKKKKHELITQSITEAVSMLGLYERDLLEATEKLEQAKEVLQRLADVNKKLGLCEKLENVLDRRNLLNFIAEEYLSDISLNASTTLLMLTGGRYDLVYDGEFFVSDNYNCGERRSVSTLSGGETFLVSLALALSLSQAICEKTMRPMEFFFLDEGFGTLDSELTDVVIDSLEKLRSERFTIGLISHVPELKQRISSKINVFPATATEGSKIEVIS